MSIVRRTVAPLLLTLAAVGCSSPRDDPAAITAEDRQQLNDAAAELDANGADTNGAHESSPHD